jgi:hypothetical protein
VSTFKPGETAPMPVTFWLRRPSCCRPLTGSNLQALAAIPYRFVTMWLAVRGAGLTRENAAERRVLVHGAAGGLGTLALQMLTTWGAKITAIARPPTMAGCLAAGATEVLDGTNSHSPRSAARSMRHSISRRGMMILRSSVACGMVLWVMRARCIQCWGTSIGMGGCAVH